MLRNTKLALRARTQVLDIDTFVEAVKIELRLSRVFMIASEGIESWSFHPLPREHVRADVLEEVCNHEDSSLCTHVKTISGLDMYSFLRKYDKRRFTMPEFCATFNRPAPATRRVLNVYDYETGMLQSYDPEKGLCANEDVRSRNIEKWSNLLDDDSDSGSYDDESHSENDDDDEEDDVSYRTVTPQDRAAATLQNFMKNRLLHIRGWTHFVNQSTGKVEWYVVVVSVTSQNETVRL